MNRRNTALQLLLLGLAPVAVGFLFCATVLACIHVPLVYKGVVTERLKEAFLFHDGDLSHLVVRTSLSAKNGLPESMAWVIPLPSLPKVMEEAGSGIFSELFSLTVPPPPPPSPDAPPVAAVAVDAPKAAAAPTIKVHAVTVAGDYRLQPVEILSDTAGGELNAWLTQNGFGAVPLENQKFYLRKGAVFLAVKVGALKGVDAELKPLHLAYRADRPALPLKFSTHSGEFDLTLYTLTPDKPVTDALAAFHLEHVYSKEVRGADLELIAPDLYKLIGTRAGWLTRFQAVHYNTAGRMVADLPADPAFGVATPVTRTAISSEMRDRSVVLVLLALGLVGLAYWQRGRQGKPWRLRALVYVVLSSSVYIGWYWMSESYVDYTKRMMISEALLEAGMVKSQVEEEATKRKSLAGVGASAELNILQGYSISRDGVISFELDPAALGLRLKFVLTPVMNNGAIEWNCAAYPEAAARHYAPASCRRAD